MNVFLLVNSMSLIKLLEKEDLQTTFLREHLFADGYIRILSLMLCQQIQQFLDSATGGTKKALKLKYLKFITCKKHIDNETSQPPLPKVI